MDFTIDLTQIIVAVIGLAFTVLTAFISKKVIPFLQEKGLEKYAKTLVSVAYTLFGENCGAEKFNYVFDKISKSKWAKYFDVERIKEAIQSAYVELCTDMGIIPSPANPTSITTGTEK